MNVMIAGCNGRMGHVLTSLCGEDPDITISVGYDIVQPSDALPYPVITDLSSYEEKLDAVIDFSNVASLDTLLDYAVRTKTPLILCTTGYSPAQLAKIGTVACEVPIFRSANMSLGINVLLELVRKASSVLGKNYDIEIVEHHHNKKLDAPSGTALMIAEAAAESCGHETEFIYGRLDKRAQREKKEIGISSVRAGTIVGVHEIIFAGTDEIIEIKHTAMSRSIFAAGAIEAAKFMAQVNEPGLYDMSNVI